MMAQRTLSPSILQTHTTEVARDGDCSESAMASEEVSTHFVHTSAILSCTVIGFDLATWLETADEELAMH